MYLIYMLEYKLHLFSRLYLLLDFSKTDLIDCRTLGDLPLRGLCLIALLSLLQTLDQTSFVTSDFSNK